MQQSNTPSSCRRCMLLSASIHGDARAAVQFSHAALHCRSLKYRRHPPRGWRSGAIKLLTHGAAHWCPFWPTVKTPDLHWSRLRLFLFNPLMHSWLRQRKDKSRLACGHGGEKHFCVCYAVGGGPGERDVSSTTARDFTAILQHEAFEEIGQLPVLPCFGAKLHTDVAASSESHVWTGRRWGDEQQLEINMRPHEPEGRAHKRAKSGDELLIRCWWCNRSFRLDIIDE